MSEQYRSLDLAYEYVLPSYDWAVRRSDAVESRIQALLGLITTITLAAVAFVRAIARVDIGDPIWLVLAGLAFIAAVVCGVIGRTTGELQIVSPEALYNEWLDKPPETFRTESIYYAGQNLRSNERLVRKRHRFLTWMIVLFALEVVLLGAWILS